MIFQDANVKVTAIENTHFAFHKGQASGKHKSYSYRFDTPDRVIVFTGDTGPNDALTELARGANLLVSEANSIEERMRLLIETGQWQVMTPDEQVRIRQQMAAGHLSPDDVGKMAARADVKTVVLTHLTAKADDDHVLGQRCEEALFRRSAHRQRPDGILTCFSRDARIALAVSTRSTQRRGRATRKKAGGRREAKICWRGPDAASVQENLLTTRVLAVPRASFDDLVGVAEQRGRQASKGAKAAEGEALIIRLGEGDLAAIVGSPSSLASVLGLSGGDIGPQRLDLFGIKHIVPRRHGALSICHRIDKARVGIARKGPQIDRPLRIAHARAVARRTVACE
jgi:beta-lactamase family protein